MALFSQRKGIRPTQKELQRESIDEELRNRLWSGLVINLWNFWNDNEFDAQQVELVVHNLWINYFKLPADTMRRFNPRDPESSYQFIRSTFFNGEWWKIYDLIEFLIKEMPDYWKEQLKNNLNQVLQDEYAAYRIVDDEVVEITDRHEIEAIESALDNGIKSSSAHLSRALELLSDRKQPDYRNSIKESVSAVEAACQVLTKKTKATLGDCIKIIKNNGNIHPAFEQALQKLYGYTSDEGGIRHALTEDSANPCYSDAKFMLVTCSAFVNYLWTKASELGIKIKDR